MTTPVAPRPDGYALNESPSEKEGKSGVSRSAAGRCASLNESPSEKEGKLSSAFSVQSSMTPQ